MKIYNIIKKKKFIFVKIALYWLNKCELFHRKIFKYLKKVIKDLLNLKNKVILILMNKI